jgi:hypothetical protein
LIERVVIRGMGITYGKRNEWFLYLHFAFRFIEIWNLRASGELAGDENEKSPTNSSGSAAVSVDSMMRLVYRWRIHIKVG